MRSAAQTIPKIWTIWFLWHWWDKKLIKKIFYVFNKSQTVPEIKVKYILKLKFAIKNGKVKECACIRFSASLTQQVCDLNGICFVKQRLLNKMNQPGVLMLQIYVNTAFTAAISHESKDVCSSHVVLLLVFSIMKSLYKYYKKMTWYALIFVCCSSACSFILVSLKLIETSLEKILWDCIFFAPV